MKTLLEVFVRYFDFLYLDPRYRLTDSSTSGSADADAQVVLTGDVLTWSFSNDRGQLTLGVAPTLHLAPENWVRLPIIRKHLDGNQVPDGILTTEDIEWLKANISRVESLFADPETSQKSCKELITLGNQVAAELFGPIIDP